jgi:carboxypeptidase Taq
MDAIEKLYENMDQLEDHDFKVEIKNAYKDLRMIKKVPKDEYLAYGLLTQEGPHIWAEAKDKNDFEMYRPTLEKIVAFNQKLVKYLETDELKGYDVLLDMYEEGFGVKEYDMYLMDVFHYDRSKGVLKESAHPFTSGVSSVDTRITTRYHEDNLASSIFSTIHEMGHAIYELQNDPKYDDTMLHGGTSLGIHESESRMYENMIGRSYAFWKIHYPKLVEIFPKELKNITLEEFYQYINRAERSLIRIEADELTYALHVLVRYEIEKQLISGKLKVKDLPKRWNGLMSKYVGKKPSNDKEGVLQDIHWSFGSFGYFPTYALGSAYAAQIYQAMNKEINVEEAVLNNQINLINDWLKEHVHKFGRSKTPKEIMMIATNEEFKPSYYVDYLIKKFTN